MLRSCCHPQKIQPKNGDDSVSNPACCDEISVPAAEKDSISVVVVPVLSSEKFWSELAEVEWILLEDVPMLPILVARGPPPDQTPLFVQNCSYLI